LLAFEETREFFRDPGILARVEDMQRKYFLGLTQGNYDTAYVEDRLRIGEVYERIGLPIKS
jgi:rsbT co-antagonist protein RsbR